VVEAYLRQSALAHLGLDGHSQDSLGEAALGLSEIAHRSIVNIRGKSGDEAFRQALASVTSLDLPLQGSAVSEGKDERLCWLGPDEWWLITEDDSPEKGRALTAQLRKGFEGIRASATGVGESRTVIKVAGSRCEDLLAKGSPLDFHESVFAEGTCAQTLLAKATVFIHRREVEAGQSCFEIYVLRSFSDYLWHWLMDAGREYGIVTLRP
jgi:sarcosine oxidase subunit gamma